MARARARSLESPLDTARWPKAPGGRKMTADRRSVLAVTTVAAFLTPFGASALNLALPAIGRDFHLDAVWTGWVATAYLLATAVCLLPIGRIADTRGREVVYLAGLTGFILSSLACAAAPSAASLIAMRVVQGAAAAMIFSTGLAILTAAFPAGRRGFVLGVNVTATYLGISVGPFAGGLLTTHFGWRSLFVATAATGAATIVAAYRALPRPWRPATAFDWAGSVLYGAGLTAALAGFSRVVSTSGRALLAAGVAGLGAFVWHEGRVPAPLLDVRLIARNRVFAFSNLAALISYSATSAITFLLSLYLQQVGRFAADAAGLVLVAQPVCQAIVSPIAGRLSDRVGPRLVATSGMALTAAGMAALAALPSAVSLPFLLGCLVVVGTGFGLFSSPNMSAIMGSVGPGLLGTAAATLATMRLVGQAVSMAIAMMLLSLVVGRVALADVPAGPLVAAIRATFAVTAVLSVGATFASMARGRSGGLEA